MEQYKIIMTDTFEEELHNIIYYILYHLKEPNIARKKHNKIIDEIFTLKYFPERYPKIYYNNKNIRKLIFDKYIIFYEVNKNIKQVQILHIYHSKQNYLSKF